MSFWLCNMNTLHVFVGAALLMSISSLGQEILHAPRNTTVFLNQSAVFKCETDSGLSSWRVNGTPIDNLLPEVHKDLVVTVIFTAEGTTVEELTITAIAEYNGTTFQCLILTLDAGSEESEIAILYIQGALSAVVAFKATNNASSVTIWWTAPFSLDVTGVDPDIWYSVLIYNVTDEDNPTTIHCTDCTNITETHYTFTPDYPSPCHVYNFSVIPFNGAGQGESSPNSTARNIQFTRTGVKATCDNVIVFFHICLEGVHGYVLRGVSDVDMGNVSQSDNQDFISYTLSANRHYSIFFEVFTSSTVINIISPDTFTTYDVQNLSVREDGDGHGVRVTGEFITDSHATGCLVVFQGPPTSPDVFKAIPRTKLEKGTTARIRVHSSTYTAVYGYDLEEDELPNTMPAVILNKPIFINSTYNVPTNDLQLLTSANISRNGSTIVIDCEFAENSPQASCVLVYREYGSPLLTVLDIPHIIQLPVFITVDNPENYTFCLFGKYDANGMEEEPVVCVKFNATVHSALPDGKKETESKQDETNDSQMKVVAITIGTVVVCILACGSAVLVLIIVRQYHNHKKVIHVTATGAAPQARNVVYDEVVLPQATSSSAIPTEPCSAYDTATLSSKRISPIPTVQNVAYAVPLSNV